MLFYAGNFTFTLDNYSRAIGQFNFARYLINSLIVSGMVTLIGTTLAILAAFAFARFTFRGGDLMFGATVATLMIPSHISLIPNYLTLAKVGLLDTYAGLILPAISNGFAAFFCGSIFAVSRRRWTRRLIWMALRRYRCCGASSCHCHARRSLPWRSTSSSASGIITFGPSSRWANKISTRCKSGWLGYTRSIRGGLIDWPLVMAASTITILPVLAGFLLVERHLVRGITMGSVK